jgi:hypothetical protein
MVCSKMEMPLEKSCPEYIKFNTEDILEITLPLQLHTIITNWKLLAKVIKSSRLHLACLGLGRNSMKLIKLNKALKHFVEVCPLKYHF